MNKEEKLHQLLQLKRQETPGDAYFDAFVDEFHRYQRSEVLNTRKSWLARWKRGLDEMIEDVFVTPARLAQGSAAAFGVLLLGAILVMGTMDSGSDSSEGVAVTHSSPFVDGSEIYHDPASKQTELAMAHLTSFDRDFEDSNYVTGEAAQAYDSVIAF